MSAPDLIARFSPLSNDPVLAGRPYAIPGIYKGRAVGDGCDWFDSTTPGADFFDAQAGSDWHSTQAGAGWHGTQAGSDWHGTQVGAKWKTNKDCE